MLIYIISCIVALLHRRTRIDKRSTIGACMQHLSDSVSVSLVVFDDTDTGEMLVLRLACAGYMIITIEEYDHNYDGKNRP